MGVSTGLKTLDDILNGGYPRERAVLLTGTPGTGKSTLSMQFLQAGLTEGEECLFISTEQTTAELQDTFAPFTFDLDHENLTITSLHARTGQTIESEEPELVIETFDGDEIIGQGFSAAFTSKRIRQVLERFNSADRVVLDSVSGLKPMAENGDVYRRGVLDLIQLFTNEFNATTLLTAEYVGAAPREQSIETIATENTVQYSVHGVIRLWREQKKGEYRRFIDVMKMRGTAYDTRDHEIVFGTDGVDILPRYRALPPTEVRSKRLPTGITGFDSLLGGGFSKGETTLLEHNGEANIDEILFIGAVKSLQHGMSIARIPRVNTSPERIDELIQRADTEFEGTDELLDTGRLFVLDALGAWDTHENVYNPRVEDAGLQYLFQQIRDKNAGGGLFCLLNTEAKVHAIGKEPTRRFRYWAPSQFITNDDVFIDVHNPNVMEDRMAEFYTDAATQALETWVDESGLQYIRLKKGTTGEIGSVRLVEYTKDPPYIRMQ